ncbi:MAG TPA: prepilin-type N-terminal cleavage/methylation domain-containing protein [Candidatus Saccharimonadales bacterium]|jgi:type II secretory pathway pseudopilin PulG
MRVIHTRRDQSTRRSGQRGDTIIEVLLALSILGFLVATTYAAMTRSMATGFNSLDRTNTQAVMNGQAGLLRAAHALYMDGDDPTAWLAIVALSEANTNQGRREDGCTYGVNANHAFYLNTNLNPSAPAATQLAPITAGVTQIRDLNADAGPRPGNGLWIEGHRITRSTSTGVLQPDVYTFYIKSCTPPVYGDGGSINRQNKTVVRLYAPAP